MRSDTSKLFQSQLVYCALPLGRTPPSGCPGLWSSAPTPLCCSQLESSPPLCALLPVSAARSPKPAVTSGMHWNAWQRLHMFWKISIISFLYLKHLFLKKCETLFFIFKQYNMFFKTILQPFLLWISSCCLNSSKAGSLTTGAGIFSTRCNGNLYRCTTLCTPTYLIFYQQNRKSSI